MQPEGGEQSTAKEYAAADPIVDPDSALDASDLFKLGLDLTAQPKVDTNIVETSEKILLSQIIKEQKLLDQRLALAEEKLFDKNQLG